MTQGLSAFLPACPGHKPTTTISFSSSIPRSLLLLHTAWQQRWQTVSAGPRFRHFIQGSNILWPLPSLWYFPLITVPFIDHSMSALSSASLSAFSDRVPAAAPCKANAPADSNLSSPDVLFVLVRGFKFKLNTLHQLSHLWGETSKCCGTSRGGG